MLLYRSIEVYSVAPTIYAPRYTLEIGIWLKLVFKFYLNYRSRGAPFFYDKGCYSSSYSFDTMILLLIR